MSSTVIQCLSTIKKIEAQLTQLVQNFEDENAKQVLHQSINVIEEIQKDLQVRIIELEYEESHYKTT
jgi:uncharacterized coiled-coil protein SlyX